MSAGVAIQVGDLVMLSEEGQAKTFASGIPFGALYTLGFVINATPNMPRIWVQWDEANAEGLNQPSFVYRSELRRIPFDNPHTDAAHLPKLRPLQRVLFDRFTDRDKPATARAMLRPWRWTWWRRRKTFTGPTHTLTEQDLGWDGEITIVDEPAVEVAGVSRIYRDAQRMGYIIVDEQGEETFVSDALIAIRPNLRFITEASTVGPIENWNRTIRAYEERLAQIRGINPADIGIPAAPSMDAARTSAAIMRGRYSGADRVTMGALLQAMQNYTADTRRNPTAFYATEEDLRLLAAELRQRDDPQERPMMGGTFLGMRIQPAPAGGPSWFVGGEG